MIHKIKSELFEWAKSFIIAVVVVFLVNIFFTPTTVYSISMNPTLVEKDILILQKNKTVEIGDIVSFKSSLKLSESDMKKLNPIQKLFAMNNKQKNLIKRVIAGPGDSIFVDGDSVYVNGEKLEESYIGSPTIGWANVEEIPENHYFLMGDNRSHSTDSRDSLVGLVSEEDIIGRVVIRVFPFDRAGNVD